MQRDAMIYFIYLIPVLTKVKYNIINNGTNKVWDTELEIGKRI